jgi:peptide/nickel transport system substrate-binding protein
MQRIIDERPTGCDSEWRARRSVTILTSGCARRTFLALWIQSLGLGGSGTGRSWRVADKRRDSRHWKEAEVAGSGFQQRMVSRRQFIGGVAVGSAGLALVACTKSGSSVQPQTKPRRGGILRLGAGGEYATESIDPALTGDQHTQSFLVYDQLTWLPPDLKPQPSLATSWSSNPELTDWVFHLRPGVKFHDGKPLTSADVIYTFQRMLDPSLGSTQALIMSGLDPSGVTAVDELTVKFSLNEPMWDLPVKVASNWCSIVPANISDKALSNHPIGTGPFMFKEFVAADHYWATKNPSYWMKGYPILDEVRISYVGEPSTRIDGLKTGQFDLIVELTPIDLKTLEGYPGTKPYTAKSGKYISFSMNCGKAPFNDVRVRTAFKLMQNRQQFLDQLLLGEGSIANDQPVPPFDATADYTTVPQTDIAQAKALLAQAGYANGLSVDFYTADLFAGESQFAVLFKEQAAAAGVDLNLKKLDVSSFASAVWDVQPSRLQFWTDNLFYRPGAADIALMYGSKSPWNYNDWANPQFDSALKAANQGVDPSTRLQDYGEAQKIAAVDGHSGIPVYHNILESATTKLGGYEAHPMGFIRDFKKLSLQA